MIKKILFLLLFIPGLLRAQQYSNTPVYTLQSAIVNGQPTLRWISGNYVWYPFNGQYNSLIGKPDFSQFLTQTQANNLYLPLNALNGYATQGYVTQNYQPKGNYLDSTFVNYPHSWLSTQQFVKSVISQNTDTTKNVGNQLFDNGTSFRMMDTKNTNAGNLPGQYDYLDAGKGNQTIGAFLRFFTPFFSIGGQSGQRPLFQIDQNGNAFLGGALTFFDRTVQNTAAVPQVQSDLNETNTASKSYIIGRPGQDLSVNGTPSFIGVNLQSITLNRGLETPVSPDKVYYGVSGSGLIHATGINDFKINVLNYGALANYNTVGYNSGLITGLPTLITNNNQLINGRKYIDSVTAKSTYQALEDQRLSTTNDQSANSYTSARISLMRGLAVSPIFDKVLVAPTGGSDLIYAGINDFKAGLAIKESDVQNLPTDLAGKVSLTGSYSNPSWLASLAWAKITGTPTTVAGYGITDAITTLGQGAGIQLTPTATGYVIAAKFNPLPGTSTAYTNQYTITASAGTTEILIPHNLPNISIYSPVLFTAGHNNAGTNFQGATIDGTNIHLWYPAGCAALSNAIVNISITPVAP